MDTAREISSPKAIAVALDADIVFANSYVEFLDAWLNPVNGLSVREFQVTADHIGSTAKEL